MSITERLCHDMYSENDAVNRFDKLHIFSGANGKKLSQLDVPLIVKNDPGIICSAICNVVVLRFGP